MGGIPFSVRPSRHRHLEIQCERMLREIYERYRDLPPFRINGEREPSCDTAQALLKISRSHPDLEGE